VSRGIRQSWPGHGEPDGVSRRSTAKTGRSTATTRRSTAKTGRSTAKTGGARHAPRHAHRMPFVLLVTGLVVGGFALLLLLNTASAANEVQRHDITAQDASIAAQLQELQNEVAASAAPGNLAQAAAALGMVPAQNPAFLVVASDGSVRVLGSPAPASAIVLPQPTPHHHAATKTASKTATPTTTTTPTSTARGDAHGTQRDTHHTATTSGARPSDTAGPSPTPTPTLTLPGGNR
jgi:hypothetical protein